MYLAVCDDQEEELHTVTALLKRWRQERRMPLRFRSFRSASELLDCTEREPFTLYLLDVMMPGIDGLAAAREIRGFDAGAAIVFLTSSPGFAFESYSVHALDYLLKPVDAQALFAILDRLALRERRSHEGLTLKCGNSIIRVPFSDLSHVEVAGRRLYFSLTDGTVHEVAGTLSEYEPVLLARPEFMRTHRSCIVNMQQVSELSPVGVRTFSGKNLPVSRLLYPQLQKDYMQLLFAGGEE